MSNPSLADASLIALARDLHSLRAALVASVSRHADDIERCPPLAKPSACNLIHYLAMRAHDRRKTTHLRGSG